MLSERAESIMLSAPPAESMMLLAQGHACMLTLRALLHAGSAESIILSAGSAESMMLSCYVIRNFSTYSTGTYVFLLVPYSRDPITLLSMDIVVETFLERGVSDLLVSTQRLQDPLYMEV